MKNTYLSVAQLEKLNAFQTVGCSENTQVFELVPNKGYRYIGKASLKQSFDSDVINVCSNTADIAQTKTDAYLWVGIVIH